jgi:RNA polymerase sigma-70 factor (ECF subfamily)
MSEFAAHPDESETLAEVARHRRERQTPVSSGSAAAAVEALFQECEARLGRFLAQMVGDRALAEDLLQDSFYEAFRCRDQLGDIENPEAWLFGIARNRALVALRRRRRFRSAFDRLVQRCEPGERNDLELLALRDLLQRTLDPEDRALLILRYMHDFEATELAAMTGRSPEVIRQRLSRARVRLIRASRRQSTTPDEGRRP